MPTAESGRNCRWTIRSFGNSCTPWRKFRRSETWYTSSLLLTTSRHERDGSIYRLMRGLKISCLIMLVEAKLIIWEAWLTTLKWTHEQMLRLLNDFTFTALTFCSRTHEQWTLRLLNDMFTWLGGQLSAVNWTGCQMSHGQLSDGQTSRGQMAAVECRGPHCD